MNLSWRWLGEFVDLGGVDAIAFAERFTCAVAEIDGVHCIGPGLEAVTVADVVAVAAHPNADKLRLATVDVGGGRSVTVVCGAPVLRVGMRVPFVAPGVRLPSGLEVKDGDVRGVRSPGMLASERDLGLGDDHGGLLELDGCAVPAGTPFCEATGADDVLFEIDNKSITHRPDLWGTYGMAREVAALLDRPLRPLDLAVGLGSGDPVRLQVGSDSHCLRYLCARLDGVRVGPAPVRLRLLLRRLGVRPISNIVDATNLVMLETGNPLHAFDARFVRGGAIEVRRARPGEALVTLDGSTRALEPTDCVIADAEGPVALAGIMGGADSEIRPDTTAVILEAAAFDANAIRKTALRLGLRTESSARFEKALDPGFADVAARRFLQRALAVAPGARVTSGLADAGPLAGRGQAPIVLHTQASVLRERLGVTPAELTDAWMDAAYGRLGFGVERSPVAARSADLCEDPARDGLAVTVPPWRATRDVTRPEDLIEELGRVYGYGNVRSEAPRVAARPPHVPPLKRLERDLRLALVHGSGLTEVLLYAFEDEAARQRLGLDDGPGCTRLGVRNPIASELRHLRRNLAPNLLAAVERNLVAGDGRQASRRGWQVALFELGRAFVPVPAAAADPAEPGADERPSLDFGVPAVAQGERGPGERAHYLDQLEPEMRAGTETAAARRRPLPWQPVRLAIAVGERLGGGADGSKFAVPPREVSERLWAELTHALAVVARAAHVPPFVLDRALPAGALPLPVAPPDPDATWLHPSRRAWICSGDGQHVVGLATLVHPAVRAALSVPAEVAVAEIDLAALLASPPRPTLGRAPHAWPGSALDVTLHVSPALDSGAVLAAVQSVPLAGADAGGLVVDVQWVATFDAPGGTARAVTVQLQCRAHGRTVTAADLDAVLDRLEHGGEPLRRMGARWDRPAPTPGFGARTPPA